MKRLFARFAFLLFLLPPAGTPAYGAVEVPPRTAQYVNDYARLLSSRDRTRLERSLAEFDRATSNQILVVILPSLEGEPPEEVTLRFAERWKPGQKGRDNGVIVGIFPQDRQARIEVGYGLEGAIPDALAATIIRQRMIPYFREGRWTDGIAAGIESLMRAARGEYDQSLPASRPTVPLFGLGLFLLAMFVVALVAILQRIRYGVQAVSHGGWQRYGGRHHGWGGGWGAGGFGGRRGGGFGGFRGGGGGFGGGGASGSW